MNRVSPENASEGQLQRLQRGSDGLAGPVLTVLNRAAAKSAESESAAGPPFRLPEDGWFQILPLGEFPGVVERPDGSSERATQVLDRAALEAIAANYDGETLIDYEHHSHDLDKRTTAAGWITGVQVRADGLYARARWSAAGRVDLVGGNYRSISPELEGLEDLGNSRYRPHLLTGAGLTNRPRLKTLARISNRGTAATNEPEPKTSMKLINRELGLAEDAAESSAVESLKTIKNRAQSLETEIATLKATNTALLESAVEADLEQFAGVIKDREAIKAALIANRDSTLKLLAALQPAKDDPARLTNRDKAGRPAPVVNATDDTDRADKIERAVQDYRITNRCTYEEADQQVRRARPELFAQDASA